MRNELSQEYIDSLIIIGWCVRLRISGFTPKCGIGDAERIFGVKAIQRFDEASERLIADKLFTISSVRDDGKPHTIEMRLDRIK